VGRISAGKLSAGETFLEVDPIMGHLRLPAETGDAVPQLDALSGRRQDDLSSAPIVLSIC